MMGSSSIKPVGPVPSSLICAPLLLLLLLVLLLLLGMSTMPLMCLCEQQQQLSNVWPYPAEIAQVGLDSLYLSPLEFQWHYQKCNNENDKIMSEAFERYTRLIFLDYYPTNPAVSAVQVADLLSTFPASECALTVQVQLTAPTSSYSPLDLDVDESYSLNIAMGVVGTQEQNGNIVIQANTVWGALHGLETLSQLVEYEPNLSLFVIRNASLVINDRPRFPWRGVLVDVARHYLTFQKLTSIVDALVYNKLNVLHLHLVDAESFPIQLPSRPTISQYALWDPSAFYTYQQLAQLIQYANLRGVRVVPEIDMPGHAASWGHAYPSIVASCPIKSATNINNIPLNPANNLTFDVIRDILTDISALMGPEKYFHLGADEVLPDCWAEDPTIQQFMQEKGWTNFTLLLDYFEEQIQPIYQSLGKIMVCWQDLLLEKSVFSIPANAIIAVWKKPSDLLTVVQSGYRTLLSAGFYLDKQVPGSVTHYEWGDTWKDFYTNEPILSLMTDEQAKLVLGGEACMWGEQVDDVNWDSRVWPRTSAMAERMWSDKSINSTNAALSRLVKHRCRLVGRGIGADPIKQDFCKYSLTFGLREPPPPSYASVSIWVFGVAVLAAIAPWIIVIILGVVVLRLSISLRNDNRTGFTPMREPQE